MKHEIICYCPQCEKLTKLNKIVDADDDSIIVSCSECSYVHSVEPIEDYIN